MPPLALHRLHQPLVRLQPLRGVAFLLAGLLRQLLRHHDDAGRPLRLARHAQLRAARHVDVRDVVVLAEHGDVRDDVHGRDVGGEDDDADGEAVGAGAGGVGRRGFAEGFDDFFDAAFEGALGGGCRGLVLEDAGECGKFGGMVVEGWGGFTFLDALEDFLADFLVG